MILPPVDPYHDTQAGEKPPLGDDTHFAAGKVAVFQYVVVAVFLFLISGFWGLQVQNPEIYGERALQNSIKSVAISAPRGRILDRDGRIIVDNYTSHRLILAREYLKEEHLPAIAQGLDLDYDDLMKRVARFRSKPKYEPIVLKEDLTPADLAFVDSHRDYFPEMELTQSQRRLYPRDGMLAHLIGYTGEINEDELDSPEFAKFEPAAVIGQSGIERQYNGTLMGVDGQRQVVVDSRGQVREVLKQKPAIPGKDLQLTIDLDLQAVAELAMDGRNGAVVALDPRTGDVLAMVSRPAFDPNKFTVGIKTRDWKEIADNPDNPLLNRAIQAQQAPGSTFKPIMALAGLETGVIDDKWTVHCPGGATFYGHYYHCWEKKGHGTIALHNAIVHSCDVFFYNVGNKLGIDRIAQYADLVGFGHKTGIDLPNEQAGTVPSEKWKLRNFREKWYAGETISVAVGQGALTVTPLQLARAYAGIVNGGLWHHPRVLKTPEKADRPDEWSLNPDHVRDVIDGMYGVVNEGGGTGVRAKLPGDDVCGKTGTAQVASADYVKSMGGRGANLKDNAWFVGYAPRAAPEIVVVALFDHGEEGSLAAPIVRDVLKAYFDKKTRIAALQQQQADLAAKMGVVSALGLPGVSRDPGVPAPASAAARTGSGNFPN
ncbi:MAG: penicillin-binding protein 2 [Bryobacteraceae bacterium]